MMQMTGRDMPLREVLIVLITCLLPPLGVFLKQARCHKYCRSAATICCNQFSALWHQL